MKLIKVKSTRSSLILESLKFYFIFLRYIIVGLSSFLIDVGVFALFYWALNQKFASLLIGRMVSGSFNFYFNKYVVYRSLNKKLLKREAMRYIILAVTIFCISYKSILELTNHFRIHIIDAKIIVDLVLFCMNFIIQRYLFQTGTNLSAQTNPNN